LTQPGREGDRGLLRGVQFVRLVVLLAVVTGGVIFNQKAHANFVSLIVQFDPSTDTLENCFK
jgi:hypothetical protein